MTFRTPLPAPALRAIPQNSASAPALGAVGRWAGVGPWARTVLAGWAPSWLPFGGRVGVSAGVSLLLPLLVLLLAGAWAVTPAMAATDPSGRYVVSRKAPNVYAAQSQSLLFLTDDCNVFVYGEPARLSGFLGGRMIEFERDSSPRCDVVAVMQRSRVKAGRYQLRVLSDVDDWYAVDNSDLRLRTLGCQRLADLDPAVLFLGADGAGVVEFVSGNACAVEGVYLPWRAAPSGKKGRGEAGATERARPARPAPASRPATSAAPTPR